MFDEAKHSIVFLHPALSVIALAMALGAAVILIWFLVRKPSLVWPTPLILLLGFGAFPIGAAMFGNVATYEHTMERSFCGTCHVMLPYTRDSNNRESTSLASRHARNHEFGSQNCYKCHRDYGMFATATTKLGGMRHVWEYYFGGFSDLATDDAPRHIHLYKPFPNASCMACHSTEVPAWRSVDEHRSMRDEIASGKVSCASEGCHGPAHPFAHKFKPRAVAPVENVQ